MSGGGPAFKRCPQCGLTAALDAQQCPQCGHVYRTQFTSPDQTQSFGAVPQPPPAQQNQPGQQHIHYHMHGPTQGGYGAPDYIQLPPGQHSVALAVVLSLLCIAGAAQLYNRQIVKGIVMFLFSILAALATGGLAMIVIWPVLVIDGICVASKLSSGRPVKQWEFF